MMNDKWVRGSWVRIPVPAKFFTSEIYIKYFEIIDFN